MQQEIENELACLLLRRDALSKAIEAMEQIKVAYAILPVNTEKHPLAG